jgi:signal transduction histidine kinase
MRRNYRLIFMLLFVAFGAVIVLTTSLITYRIESQSIREDFLARAQSIISIKHDQFEKFFNRPAEALGYLAEDPETAAYLKNFEGNGFLKLAGMVLSSNDDILRLSLSRPGSNQTEHLVYDKALHRFEKSMLSAAVKIEPDTANDTVFIKQESYGGNTTFSINRTVYDGEKFLGQLSLLLDLSRVAALFESSPAGFIHLCDERGNFLVYNDRLLGAREHKSIYEIFHETADDILFSDIYVGENMYGRTLLLGGGAEYKIFMQMNETILEKKREKITRVTLYLILGVLLFSLPVAYLFALVPKRLNDEIVEKNDMLRELNSNLNTRVMEAVEANRQKDRIMFNQSKNAAMGEMINMITHQWRQPLSSISALASKIKLMAQLGPVEGKALEGEMQQVIDSSVYLSRTIEDFKDFFKPDREKVDVMLKSVIDEALKFSAHPIAIGGITVHKQIRSGGDTITTYKNELIQVLMNLLKNSVDQLNTRDTEDKSITVATSINDGLLEILVEDNGGGIPEHLLPHIFDEYFTAKEGGTGLGLYMSRMIMRERFNGSVEAENIVDDKGERAGARFILTLPL